MLDLNHDDAIFRGLTAHGVGGSVGLSKKDQWHMSHQQHTACRAVPAFVPRIRMNESIEPWSWKVSDDVDGRARQKSRPGRLFDGIH